MMLDEGIKEMLRERSWLRISVASVAMFLLASVLFELRGQEIEVQAPESVYAGQQFQVTFVLPGKPTDFQQPDWGGVEMLFGPAVGSSSQMTVINGKVNRSTSYTYSYVCRASSAGDFTIGAARAELASGRQSSAPFVVRVLSSGGAASAPSGGDGAQAGTSKSSASGDEAFVALELSRNEAYVGQPVVATVKIYTRLDLVGFDDIRFPSFDGFWVKEVPTSQHVTFSSTVVNGREYNVGVLRKYLLYPQKAGVQNLDGLEAVVQYRVRERPRSFFDEFMGSFSTSVMSLKGARKQVRVKALPTEGVPSGYNGAVGKFTVASKVDKEELETNDALTYTLTIEGTGNLHTIARPDIAFPSTVEAYDPVVKEDYAVRGDNQSGRISYEYVLIPRAPGEVEIPEYSFSYFNPASGKYEAVKVAGYKLKVRPGAGGGTPMVVGGGSGGKEDVQVLGNDIRHIHSIRGRLYTRGESFTGGGLYRWWLMVLALLTACAWIYLSRKQRVESDRVLLRDRRARSVARKRLRRAKELLDSGDELFYAELLRALWGYLGDKLHLEPHELSSDSVGASLRRRGVPESEVTAVHDAIAECEYARYGVNNNTEKAHESYDRALEVIMGLDEWLKRGGNHTQKEGK